MTPKRQCEKDLNWPGVLRCPEKRRLQAEFIRAIQEVLALCGQQTQALIDGDPEFSRFDLPLHYANERKDHAKYALIAHIDSHQCGEEMDNETEQG
jgi:hypothetical protein